LTEEKARQREKKNGDKMKRSMPGGGTRPGSASTNTGRSKGIHLTLDAGQRDEQQGGEVKGNVTIVGLKIKGKESSRSKHLATEFRENSGKGYRGS